MQSTHRIQLRELVSCIKYTYFFQLGKSPSCKVTFIQTGHNVTIYTFMLVSNSVLSFTHCFYNTVIQLDEILIKLLKAPKDLFTNDTGKVFRMVWHTAYFFNLKKILISRPMFIIFWEDIIVAINVCSSQTWLGCMISLQVIPRSCNKACLLSSNDIYEVTNIKVKINIKKRTRFLWIRPFHAIKANQDHERMVN